MPKQGFEAPQSLVILMSVELNIYPASTKYTVRRTNLNARRIGSFKERPRWDLI